MVKRLAIFCFVILVSYFLYLNYSFFHQPLLLSQTAPSDSVKVYPGFHINQLAYELQKKKLWNDPYSFMMLATLYGFSKQLRFGEYAVIQGMTAHQLLKNIASSTGLVSYNFRIEEGATLKSLMNSLTKNTAIFKTENPLATHYDSSLKIASLLGKEFINPRLFEGLLYPNTYQFVWGMKDVEVIHRAYVSMLKKVAVVWGARDPDLPIHSPYQLLIVASLIETEASNLHERPLIAGVIYNRLEKHMRLQIDPTVMYGLGLPYGSSLVDSQLKIKTPYNTYLIDGLPPTPIAMPSLTSLEAAAHPAKITALYYVADGKGSHVFSDTYALHQQAVARYRAFMKKASLPSRIQKSSF